MPTQQSAPFPCFAIQINATEFVLGLQLLTQASEREKLSLAFLVSVVGRWLGKVVALTHCCVRRCAAVALS